MKVKISASLMCADLSNLGQAVSELEAGGVDWLHFDVMDGSYVPNFALGPLEMRGLREITPLPFDVHLMVEQPERHLDLFAEAGADWLTFHVEATRAPLRTLTAIRERGLKAGIALNPATPTTMIEWLLPYANLVTLMTVEPGYAGQKWFPNMANKVKEVRRMVEAAQLPVEIEVDGNINPHSIPVLVDAGASVLVGGSSGLFVAERSLETGLTEMRQAINHNRGTSQSYRSPRTELKDARSNFK